jgi:hypothetical protein
MSYTIPQNLCPSLTSKTPNNLIIVNQSIPESGVKLLSSGRIMIQTPNGMRCAGVLQKTENKQAIFLSTRYYSKHHFRKLNSWAIDDRVLSLLQRENVTLVILHDKETNIYYFATLQTIAEHSITRDYGEGLQAFLPLQYWKKSIQEIQQKGGGE